jgi:hypothetical protein
MRDISKLAEQLSSLSLVEAAELRKMLEKQWARPPKQKPKFKFNEGKVCDAVILYLEERESSTRENLRSPEDTGHKFPVELAFNLGPQVFALEHTGIEPFDGHLEMEAQTKTLFTPITDALKDSLGTEAYFELRLPLHALRNRKQKELAEIQSVIIDWVIAAAPTIEKRPYPDYRGTSDGPLRIDKVPFDLTLIRFEPPLVPGRHFEIRHMVDNLDELRAARMQIAIDKKFPKLAAWKENENAKNVLVLEQNDMQLTNPGIVADTFIPLAKNRPDRPDETYLVVTFPTGDWWLWPILIGDRPYDDFVRSDEQSYWEYDPAELRQLTRR